MNENNELLMHIYKSAEMGVYSTTGLINALKNKDNKIKHVLECELKGYEKLMFYFSIAVRKARKMGGFEPPIVVLVSSYQFLVESTLISPETILALSASTSALSSDETC